MNQQTNRARIINLWIGEEEPDAFSWWIQVCLTFKETKGFWNKIKLSFLIFLNRAELIDFSHNAIYFKGKIWHSTTPGGVRDDDPEVELKGCRIRYLSPQTLNISEDAFSHWLMGESGKPYSHGQNIAFLVPHLRPFFKNGNAMRNCSEFLAVINVLFAGVRFSGQKDWALPTCTLKVLKPKKCDYNLKAFKKYLEEDFQ